MNAWAGSSLPGDAPSGQKRKGGVIFHIGTAAGKAAGQPPRGREQKPSGYPAGIMPGKDQDRGTRNLILLY